MSGDNITTKELLLQLMKEYKELRADISQLNVLLERHIEASSNRDAHIVKIETRLDGIEAKQDAQDIFRTRVLTVWSSVWSVVTIVAAVVINRLL